MLSTALPVVMRGITPSARSTQASCVARQTARAHVKSVALSSRVSVNHIGRQPRSTIHASRARALTVHAKESDETPSLEWDPKDPTAYTIGILGDLHVDPRDLEHTMVGREHMKAHLKDAPNKFVVSLGDLGESKDCTETKQLYAGTTECFNVVKEYLDGFETPFDIVGGNHDLEGIDEFMTDKDNLEAYLRIMGKKTPQFAHEIAPKVLLVGVGSTVFRDAPFTSHEVFVDAEQLAWFEKTIEAHPASDGWVVFCFSHAPIIGSALRVLQECHVVNGCCWLNHNDKVSSQKFIQTVRANSNIKAWFSGHFHLSHDYEDSITFPGGNKRGSCVFAQTGVMTARSTRDGKRHSRFVRGNENGFEICTVDHGKDGVLRLDATVFYQDECLVGEDFNTEGVNTSCSVVHFAHPHEDYDHDQWFQAYTPEMDDGCYLPDPNGVLNPVGGDKNFASRDAVCWWHMKDGAVLGGHNGMIIEYDPSTLAPLGMVVSRDELENRRVAIIDDGYGTDALALYDDDTNDITVVQPNEDGSYWRKVVRNKIHRTREMRKMAAAKAWLAEQRGADSSINVLSSYGPYKNTAGQVMGLSTKAYNPKAKVASKQ